MIWERLTDIPEPTGGFACGSTNGRLILVGGTNWEGGQKNWLSSIWLYDPRKNIWSSSDALNQPVAYAAFGQRGANEIWTAGGSTGSATIHQLNFIGETRTLLELPEATVYGGGALIGNVLFLLGGAPEQENPAGLSGRFVSIDLNTGLRAQPDPYPVHCFGFGAVVACGSRIFVCGGAIQNPDTGSLENLNQTWAYSAIVDRWEELPPLPVATRGMAAVALDDRHVLVAGGFQTDFTSDSFVYDLEQGSSRATAPLPYPGMVGLVKIDDWIYCMGGEDAMKHRTNALFRTPARSFA